MSYASPLRWPSDVARHRGPREPGTFKIGGQAALLDIEGELRRFGATNIAITSALDRRAPLREHRRILSGGTMLGFASRAGEIWAALERLEEDRWWVGPVGWLLEGVLPLPVPVPCKGAMGFWTVPPDAERAVLEQT